MKIELEREARRRKTSLAGILDLAAREWLNKSSQSESDDQQALLHASAPKCFGMFEGVDRYRSENARQAVRRRMRRPHSDDR
ncbi:MAG: hypothetical protein JO340_01165 [Acidobacteriaceae bacterium]|nr:hypothetical protein [Acidobacteriaceae bacterium]